jgi:hypothetical protein
MRKKVFNNLLFTLACFDTLFILSYGVSVSYKSLACYPFNKLVGSLAYPFLGPLQYLWSATLASLKFRREAWMFIVPVLVITLGYNFPKFLERRFFFVDGTLDAEAQEFSSEKNYKYYKGYFADLSNPLRDLSNKMLFMDDLQEVSSS